MRNESAAVAVDRPNAWTPSSGTIVRSCPTIPPTSALTPTSKRELAGILTQAEPDLRTLARCHRARLPSGLADDAIADE